MSKIIVMILLVALNGSAMAEWTKVTEEKDGSAVYYSDTSSIQKSAGNLTIIWELTDLKEPDIDGIRSTKAQVEYDCVRERFRVLYAIAYSQNMGSGDVIVKLSPSEIENEPISPDSIDACMWQLACGQK